MLQLFLVKRFEREREIGICIMYRVMFFYKEKKVFSLG
jgi:hypothetical protein